MTPSARPHRLATLLLCTAGMAACASSSVGTRTFEHPLGMRQDLSIENQTLAPTHTGTVPAPPERVAEEVAGVYRYLGLDAATASGSTELTFFTPPMRITGRLYQGEKNSAYIDCGTAMQGERADLYDVEFALVTRLRGNGEGGTRVETRLEGRAWDRFSNESPVFCTGTGKLEREIAQLLRQGGVG